MDPITKLIEVVGNGIGWLIEPIQIKRLAKANAKAANIACNELDDGIEKKVKISSEGFSVEGLKKRAEQRVVFQEIKKQENIENIIKETAQNLENEKEVSEEAVDDDWITEFFEYTSKIGNEEMQIIWGKILAGEIKEPGSYSLRTLDALRKISYDEAKLFSKMVPYIISDGKMSFIIFDKNIFSKYNIKYSNLLKLAESGIIYAWDSIEYKYSLSKEEALCLRTYKKVATVYGKICAAEDFSFKIFPLTSVGKELLDITEKSSNDDYFLDICEKLYQNNKSKADIRVYDLKSTKGSKVDFYKDNEVIIK